MVEARNNRYFAALTGMRAVAVFFVFMHHYNPFKKLSGGVQAYQVVDEFHVGVNFFFVLSGFLIAYRYGDNEAISYRSYMLNRIAKIYPVYLVLTTVTFAFFWLNAANDDAVFMYLMNISFLKGFMEQYKFSGIAQGWSLTVEETFYVLAPLFFIAIRRHALFFIILPILSIAVGCALVALFAAFPVRGGLLGSYEFMFGFTFFGRCIEFFAGIALATVLQRNLMPRTFRYATLSGLAVICLCIYALAALRSNAGLAPLAAIIHSVMLPVFGVAVFYYGLITENSIVSRAMSSRPLVLIGKSSYVFYLIHMGVVADFITSIYSNIVFSYAALTILSIAIYKLVEDPLQRLIRRFGRQSVNTPLAG